MGDEQAPQSSVGVPAGYIDGEAVLLAVLRALDRGENEGAALTADLAELRDQLKTFRDNNAAIGSGRTPGGGPLGRFFVRGRTGATGVVECQLGPDSIPTRIDANAQVAIGVEAIRRQLAREQRAAGAE